MSFGRLSLKSDTVNWNRCSHLNDSRSVYQLHKMRLKRASALPYVDATHGLRFQGTLLMSYTTGHSFPFCTIQLIFTFVHLKRALINRELGHRWPAMGLFSLTATRLVSKSWPANLEGEIGAWLGRNWCHRAVTHNGLPRSGVGESETRREGQWASCLHSGGAEVEAQSVIIPADKSICTDTDRRRGHSTRDFTPTDGNY